MAKGGARKGAGRKKGSKNRHSAEIAQKAAAEGVTPLEFMLKVMRGEPPAGADPATIVSYRAMQFEAAKASAPYMHPRLNAIEHSGPDGGPMKVIVEHAA